MSRIAIGHGSEWHLMRHLAYHRATLTAAVEREVGCAGTRWLDFPYAPRRELLDAEWRGLDFLDPDHPARTAWTSYWPRTGSPQCWDAVGLARASGRDEWLLVEAKANVEELASHCCARDPGSRQLIAEAFDSTRERMGVSCGPDAWLSPYYQYANRLACLSFLESERVPARIVNLCFVGDRRDRVTCPSSADEWRSHLRVVHAHLGLTGESDLEARVHHVFVPVAGEETAAPRVPARRVRALG